MEVLFETEVTPDQIDHLGHMNVAYYSAAARTGGERLLADLGLIATADLAVFQRDNYVRHHHEQLVGSPLAVRGGVLDVSAERLRAYEELVNTDTGALAATFVLSFEAIDRAGGRPAAIPAAVVEAASAATVELPDHGRPRSVGIDTDPATAAPTLARLQELELALRLPRAVDPGSCDEDGVVRPGSIAELVWGGEPIAGRGFRPLETLADGGPLGFATMETRATWTRLVRAGDRVQSYGAEVDIRAKTMLGRHWLFDVDTAELVAVFSVVSLAFDVTNRRAVEIPEDVRRRMAQRLHPDLAGPDGL